MFNATPDLLQGLAPAGAEGVLALGVRIPVSGGESLFRLGDIAESLYVVERGRIALRLPMEVGGRPRDVIIEERGAGQTVGWSALIPPHRFTLKATAPLDSVVLAFPRATLLDYFTAAPAVGYAVMRNVAAVTGHRLQLFQTMWLREMQRTVAINFT